MKVLLIDDSSTMRKIQKKTLLQMGVKEAEISEASNGVDALDVLKSKGYDFELILCDINMPEMNGIETVTAIRAIPECKDIIIVMCTSVAEKSSVIEAIKVGANNYLVKPFSPDGLKDKIDKSMKR